MQTSALALPIVFLVTAVVAVPLFKRFGFGAVLAYLATGVLLGPAVLGLVNDPDRILQASEIGVVMMLFILGLELSFSRLKAMRRPIFVNGGMQFIATTALLTVVAVKFGLSDRSSLVVSAALAFSSTAVGLQILAERKELITSYGRTAFAILLLQDLMAIPLLAAIPLVGYSRSEEGLTVLAVFKAVGAFLVLLLVGRYFLSRMFRVVARTNIPEVFTAAALLVVLGSAFLMESAGLSAGLGAFIAGVMLAESEYRHEVEAQIEPFKGLLLGLFFIAVGMSINMDAVMSAPVRIAVMLMILIAVKFAVLYVIGRHVEKLSSFESLQLAAILAAGGEFSFVIFNQAQKFSLIESTLTDQLLAVVSLSMALTPVLVILVAKLRPSFERKKSIQTPEYDEIPQMAQQPQVLIAGFGRFGQIVGRFLTAQKIPYVAIDNSAEQVNFMRRFGNKLFYGDAGRPELLRSAGGEHIRIFVIALEKSDETKRAVRIIRRMYPKATIFSRARDRAHAWELMDMGAKPIREMFFSSMEMSRRILVELQGQPDVAARRVEQFVHWDENLLQEQFLVYDDEELVRKTARNARAELESLFDADLDSNVLDERV